MKTNATKTMKQKKPARRTPWNTKPHNHLRRKVREELAQELLSIAERLTAMAGHKTAMAGHKGRLRCSCRLCSSKCTGTGIAISFGAAAKETASFAQQLALEFDPNCIPDSSAMLPWNWTSNDETKKRQREAIKLPSN